MIDPLSRRDFCRICSSQKINNPLPQKSHKQNNTTYESGKPANAIDPRRKENAPIIYLSKNRF